MEIDSLTIALLFPIYGRIEIIPQGSSTIVRTKKYEVSIPVKASSYLSYSRSGLYKKLGRLSKRRKEKIKLLKAIIEHLKPWRAYRLARIIYGIRKVKRFRDLFKPILERATRNFILYYKRIPLPLYRKLRKLFGGFEKVEISLLGRIKRLKKRAYRIASGFVKALVIDDLVIRVKRNSSRQFRRDNNINSWICSVDRIPNSLIILGNST